MGFLLRTGVESHIKCAKLSSLDEDGGVQANGSLLYGNYLSESVGGEAGGLAGWLAS